MIIIENFQLFIVKQTKNHFDKFHLTNLCFHHSLDSNIGQKHTYSETKAMPKIEIEMHTCIIRWSVRSLYIILYKKINDRKRKWEMKKMNWICQKQKQNCKLCMWCVLNFPLSFSLSLFPILISGFRNEEWGISIRFCCFPFSRIHTWYFLYYICSSKEKKMHIFPEWMNEWMLRMKKPVFILKLIN